MKLGSWGLFGRKTINKVIDTEKNRLIGRIMKNGLNTVGDDSYGLRPSMDFFTYLTSDEGVKIPIYPLTYPDMYAIYQYSDILRIVIDALKREIFKNGFEAIGRFEFKCTNRDCGKEFEAEPENMVCDKCGMSVRRPDTEQEKTCKGLIEKSLNKNNQTLEDILRMMEQDLDVTDNSFLLLVKEYVTNDQTGEHVDTSIQEILRVSPANMGILADQTGMPCMTDAGLPVWVCPNHRRKTVKGHEHTHCSICGARLLPCYAKANLSIFGATRVMETEPVFYAQDEVLHISKFIPSLLYGFSPLIALWAKVVSMMWMDRYIHQYYYRQRPPKGMMFVGTRNVESFKKTWAWTMDRLRVNPHEVVPIAVETEGKGDVAKYMHFDLTLEEMQFGSVREEFRRLCGATYGVMPLFSGDITSAGGLHNEGLQVTVTTRAVEDAQRIYNTKVLPFITKSFGVTDWDILVKSPEVRDEMKDFQLHALKVGVAQQMSMLGFDVELSHEGEFNFEYTKKPERPPMLPESGGSEAGLRERSVPLQGETSHLHPSEGRAEGEPEMLSVEQSLLKGIRNAENIVKGQGQGVGFTVKKQTLTEEIDYALKNLFKFKFADLTKKQSETLKKVLVTAFKKNKSVYETMKEIQKLPVIGKKISLDEIERIVRTETASLELKGKELGFKEYEKDFGEQKYKYLTAGDDRVCPACKEAAMRTSKGVSLERLKEIVAETTRKYYKGLEPRDYIVHPNDRCDYTLV